MEIDHLFKYAVGKSADGSLFWYARGEASPEPIRELTSRERLAVSVAGVHPEWSGGEPVIPARLDPCFSLSLSAEQCDVLLSGEEAIKRHLPRDLAAEHPGVGALFQLYDDITGEALRCAAAARETPPRHLSVVKEGA